MRVASFVCAALGVGTALGGCRSPKGAGIAPLGSVALPAAPDGREVRVTFELPNGVAVVLEESHVTPTVALQAWVAAGAVDEAPGETGVAHLVERVALGGARGPDAAGPALSAWSSHDATVFEALLAGPGVGAGLEALAAALARASFEAPEVERARAEILAELRHGAADPAAVATRALFAGAFESHPYARDVRGTEAAVAGLTREQVAAFHRRAYVGPNVTLVAVGDFDARAVRGQVAAVFARLARGEARPPVSAPPPAGPRVSITPAAARADHATLHPEHLMLGFRLPPLEAAELPAVDVLAVALAHGGDGEGGRLGRELVRNRQLAVGTRASVFVGRAAGLLALDARLVAGRADEAARVVLDEALALTREELPPGELAAARSQLEGDIVRGKATTSAHARKLGFFATVARDPGYEERYLERLRALGSADVRAVAAKVLRASNVAIAALAPGDERAAAALSARLREVAVASETRADARRRAAPATAVTAAADVVRVVLPAGPRVLVLRDPTVPAMWVQALWAGGLRAEDPRSNGVTSLLAATLTRGTRTRPPERVAADAAALGGALEGVAGPDELGVRAEFLSSHWEAGLALLADCLRHPAFPEAEIDAARRAQLSLARAEEDDAARAAERLVAGALWPRHPYRLPLLGTPESLSLLTRRRVADHFQRTYGARNLVIAVVGDVDTERVVGRLQALFAEAPAAVAPLAPAPPPPADGNAATAELVRLAPGDAARLAVGYPGLGSRDPDRAAALVLARALEARLAADASSPAALVRSWSGVDAGTLTLDVAATPDTLDAAVPALRAALARIVAAGFGAPEVERARQILVAERVRALEHRAAVASALAREEALGPDAGTGRRSTAALAAVTPDAVTRVARRLLDPRREIVAAVRPPAAAVAKAASPKLAPKPGPGGGRAPAP